MIYKIIQFFKNLSLNTELHQLLNKRCYADGRGNYYYQSLNSIYNFTHDTINKKVSVYNFGIKIIELRSSFAVNYFITSIQ